MHTLLKSGNEKAAPKMDDGQNVGSHAAEKKSEFARGLIAIYDH